LLNYIFQITFVPRLEDNGSQLRCEAINDAVSKPVVNMITLDVESEFTSTTVKPVETELPDYDQTDIEDDDYDYESNKLDTTKDNNNNNNKDKDNDNDEYEDYNDEDYYYEYPDNVDHSTEDILTDPAFIHPELINEAIFSGKIDFNQLQEPPIRSEHGEKNDIFGHKTEKKHHVVVPEPETDTTWYAKKNNKNHHRGSENEVYPKDAPYTQDATKSGGNWLILSIIMVPAICLIF
jgi:hypothetical protein